MASLLVKNRAPAPIQITAEQLLREAKERGLEEQPKAPKQFITDVEELKLYQQTKRKDFEDQLRRQRQKIGIWCKYALWEAQQKEYERARSIFERALDVDYRNPTIWLKYSEMELKNKFINHARNIYNRAVSLLPRIDQFWFKFTYMEEYLGAVEEARQVFERWMKWEPSDHAWYSYIKFEMRQGNISVARGIYERYILCHPTSRAYLKYAKWEEKVGEFVNARNIYERALVEVHPMERSISLYRNFAQFEERCKEYDRARVIYQYAIENANQYLYHDDKDKDRDINDDIEELKQDLIKFEKKYGTKQSIDEAVLTRRRSYYESQVTADGYNYDSWFDYIRLEEAESGDIDKIRNIYERAISFVPPIQEKKYWTRYIYLWINYALFEEIQVKDISRTREVYQNCLKIIPHKVFTFGKIWLLAAQFEIRQKDLTQARKLLGRAIGLCPKENLFKGYIELELQLGEIDRCRILYSKYIETFSFNCTAWKNFAQLEINLGEIERARSIYELAISQSELDMPELLWKAYIDFEINENEYDKVRAIYERLLEKTSHVKVWISYGQFEASLSGDDSNNNEIDKETMVRVRKLLQRGYESLKSQGLKEERILLLETWRELESRAAVEIRDITSVEAKFPRKIKMRRPVGGGTGTTTTDQTDGEDDYEEYYEYQFPDDETKIVGLKLLENAMKWKMKALSATTKTHSQPTVEAEEENENTTASGDLSGVFGSDSGAKKRKFDDDEINDSSRKRVVASTSAVADSNEIDIDI